jgi:hypothetical protein
MQMQAKGDGRLLTFYLSKEEGQVDLFVAGGNGDRVFRVLSQAFMDYANNRSLEPPPNDWPKLRDTWWRWHICRLAFGIIGLSLLILDTQKTRG